MNSRREHQATFSRGMGGRGGVGGAVDGGGSGRRGLERGEGEGRGGVTRSMSRSFGHSSKGPLCV